ncbi:MAG: hypothetical protein R2793_05715 [Flavobacteriaceae bacterium]
MKKIYYPTLLFLVTLSLTACLGNGEKSKDSKEMDPSEFKTETVAGLYEMQIPEYMKSTKDLNTDASLQFQNIYKETYIAVIDEPKQDFIDTFTEMNEYDESKSPAENYQITQMNYFTEGLTIKSQGRAQKMTINGLEAYQQEMVGKVPGIDFDIFYLMTFIEGKETLYMMMEWTLSSNEDKYKSTFEYMANSFKEL